MLRVAVCLWAAAWGFAAEPEPGVGLKLRRAHGRIEVQAVLPKGPADRAGVRAGDRITAVDGSSTAGARLKRLVQSLKGPAGSSVLMELEPASGGERRTVSLVREAPDASALASPAWRLGERTHGVVGIGVRLRKTIDGATIIEVYPASPAKAAGLREGDVIREVDGIVLRELGLDAAVQRIRGKPDTAVALGLMRGGKALSPLVLRRSVVHAMHPNPMRQVVRLPASDDGEECVETYWSTCECDSGCNQAYCEKECSLEVEDGDTCHYSCSDCYCSACA